MDQLTDFDYQLPPGAIAQEPLADRSASKLLYLHKESGEIDHLAFRDAPKLFSEGDLLVLNDTRVTALRLFGRKKTGARVELLLLREEGPTRFICLAKPGRRLQPGTILIFEDGLFGEILDYLGEGQKLIRFKLAAKVAGKEDKDRTEAIREKIAGQGKVPLPPYIHQALADVGRYQTVYAAAPGSAAAPTAGLHFTGEVLAEFKAKGVQIAKVTLDVGLDTFKPVQSENLAKHPMHGERCMMPPETARLVNECQGRIVAVGTTSARTLESFAVGPRQVAPGSKISKLFVRPGYKFKVVDGMFTNFHLPRTTMLMMISALAGREKVLYAYCQALERGYRFLSFGDAMLIF